MTTTTTGASSDAHIYPGFKLRAYIHIRGQARAQRVVCLARSHTRILQAGLDINYKPSREKNERPG